VYQDSAPLFQRHYALVIIGICHHRHHSAWHTSDRLKERFFCTGMELAMKRLPIGIQSLREIIEGNYVYADKTRELYNLIREGKYYFLSRPRRFGKSLLIDTAWELFSGSRQLFEGLWIAGPESDYDFEPHPIVRIDMTQVSIKDARSLEASLCELLMRQAGTEGITINIRQPADVFRILVESLCEKYGKRVVILVDEYDKPIIDHIGSPRLAQANREVLGNFYGIIKGQDASIAFCLFTGVSKFARLSLFSNLNNLRDITLRTPYAGICGITETEFESVFSERMVGIDYERVLQWYDGYTWDGATRVFNPFSLLNFFQDREFNNYWYASGTPQFLMQNFKVKPEEYANIQQITISEALLDSHNIEDAPLVSLLFQTGFLTVKNTLDLSPKEYIVGFPNEEVSGSFARQFLSTVAETPDPYSLSFIKSMREALDAGKPERITGPLNALYAALPYHLHLESEAYYHSLFLAVMQFLGFQITGELPTSEGRIDGVLVRPNKKTYLIEFKYVSEDGALDTALADALIQIESRAYASRYVGTDREIYKLAVAVAGRGKVKVAVAERE
jgi:hypothetical protein